MAAMIAASTGGAAAAPSLLAVASTLKIMTWNIWFDQFQFERRNEEILRICGEHLPDVICFQEVTYPFCHLADALAKTTAPWLSGYKVSPLTHESYFTLTLCKQSLNPKFSRISFPTGMRRDLLIAEVTTPNGCTLHVGNVHLESLDSANLREAQLQVCSEHLPKGSSILVGDFNFCSYRNFDDNPALPLENLVLKRRVPHFVDLWPALHSTDGDVPGYTYDTEANRMLYSVDQHYKWRQEQMRYDRVLCSLQGNRRITPSAIALVGNSPVTDSMDLGASGDSDESSAAPAFSTPPRQPIRSAGRERAAIFPSDHFGLLAEFDVPALLARSSSSDSIA